MMALDFATQVQEMKAIAGQPDYALGSVHAVTRDGTLVIASASGSQLASYAWGAASVIFVVGAQKLVPTLEAAHERIYEHSLKLEDARAYAAYGQNSRVGKILEIHQEDPAASTSSSSGSRSVPDGRRRDARETPANDGAARGGRSRPRPLGRSCPRRVRRLRMPLLAAGVSRDRTGRTTTQRWRSLPSGTSR